VIGKELMDTNWQWFGRDRIGKRGGGIGFLVSKRLKAKILSNCESTLWIQIGGENMWCIAVVYLLPKDSEGNNRDILGKLQQDIIRYRMVGKVLILGDFNGRIGELPNRVVNSGLEGIDSELVILRTSKDKKVDSCGRAVLNYMNAVGMVVINGVSCMADFTSFQYQGTSVIDLIWMEEDHLRLHQNLKVWNDDFHIISDHRLVTIDVQMKQCRSEIGQISSSVASTKAPLEWRWNTDIKRNQGGWVKLKEVGSDIMGQWTVDVDELKKEGGLGKEKRQVAEELWGSWSYCLDRALKEGLGRRTIRNRGRQVGWDSQTAILIQQRNESRNRRDRSFGALRDSENSIFRRLRARVKWRVKEMRERFTCGRNELILKARSKDPKYYWKVLKRVVGVANTKAKIPRVVWDGNSEVYGDDALRVWQNAFESLGKVIKTDHFDEGFCRDIKLNLARSKEGSGIDYELDKDIMEGEVGVYKQVEMW